MAREHARILTRIWTDGDWTALPPDEQRMYFLLLSQRTVSQAGVVPMQTRKWAKGSAHTSEEDIAKALAGLEAANFVTVDEDTEEVLVRSFIRNDGVAKIPNVFKAALKAATNVESPKLRRVLAGELRKMRRKDASKIADELFPNLSGTNAEPIESQSGTDAEPLKVREGIPQPCGEGVGEGVVEPLVGGHLGGSHASAGPREAAPSPAEQRPPLQCPKHRNTENPPPCRACGQAREARERFDAEQAQRATEARTSEARQRANDRAAAIARCGLCDDAGYRGTALCDHDPNSADRAKRGRALTQAALTKREAS